MKMCCEAMKYHTENHCGVHDDPFECPDRLVLFDEESGRYGLIIHDGGQSYIQIDYCPWCGRRLLPKTK